MRAATKSSWRFWGAWITPMLVVWLVLFCTGIDTGSGSLDSDSSFLYERRAVQGASRRIEGSGAADPFQNLIGLALAHDQQSFYALDSFARRVHRISLDGTVQASMGGEGSGPGELAGPVSIGTVAEGVWVLDTDNLRTTLFGPDGRMLNAISLDAPALGFAPVGGDAVVVPAMVLPAPGRSNSPEIPPLLWRVDGLGSEAITLDPGVVLPDLLASSGPRERFMWRLARVSNDAIAIVDRSSLAAWRVSLSPDGRRISGVEPLAVPEGIRAWVRGIEPPEPDMRLMAVSGVRMVDQKLWVMTPGLGGNLLGFTSPLAGRVVELVLPGALGNRELIDAIVLSDRVIATTLTDIILAELSANPAVLRSSGTATATTGLATGM